MHFNIYIFPLLNLKFRRNTLVNIKTQNKKAKARL